MIFVAKVCRKNSINEDILDADITIWYDQYCHPRTMTLISKGKEVEWSADEFDWEDANMKSSTREAKENLPYLRSRHGCLNRSVKRTSTLGNWIYQLDDDGWSEFLTMY